MTYLVSNSLKIYYEVHGHGSPIVLLHGYSSSFERNWLRLGWVEFLTAHEFQVIGLDLRGHGHSDKPLHPDLYTTELMSQDVLHLLDHLHIGPVDLFGFSMGGGMALHLAMNEAQAVQRVAVCGVGDAAIRGQHDPRQLEEIAFALTTDDPYAKVTPLGQYFRTLVDVPGNDLRALAALMRGPGWPGYVELKQAPAVPVLIVKAEQDEYMPDVEQLMKAMPQAQLLIIPATNHLTVIRDKRCKEIVIQFLHEGS
jgi:pimeloyl-ACP methyl ester carboxylesterase